MTTTSYYRIHSTAGKDFGTWPGPTAVDALLALHRDAGYSDTAVWIDESGRLAFADGYRELCGDVTDWDIVRSDEAAG